MPLAKIHVLKGRYDEARIAKVSGAVQAALMNTLRVPAEDFYQLIFELPKNRFLHTPSFVGIQYTDDLMILEISFIQGEGDTACTVEGHQHARRGGCQRVARRYAHHTLRGSGRKHLIWSRRSAARQRGRACVRLRLLSAYADSPSNEGKLAHPCSLNEENTMSSDETLSYDVFVPTCGLCRRRLATTAVLF